SDIFCPRAKIPSRLDIHLPDTTEPVKKVHHHAAHKRLQRLVDIGKIHSLLQDFIAIDSSKDLGYGRNKCGIHSRKLWPLPGRLHEFLRVVCQEFDVPTGPVFQDKGDSARRANSWDGGRREKEGLGLGQLGETSVHTLENSSELFFGFFAFFPRSECDEEKRVIGRAHRTQQTKTDDGRGVLNSRRLS